MSDRPDATVPRPPRSARTVPCPHCGKVALFAPSNPWRPFCSERCRTLDLGAWASESYRIAGKPRDDEPGDAADDGKS